MGACVPHQALLDEIFAAGGLSTLHRIHAIETRVVNDSAVEDAYDFYSTLASLSFQPLAVFYHCKRRRRQHCTTYSTRPRLCVDMTCEMHEQCIVCNSPEHPAIEINNDSVQTRCPVICRADHELTTMRERWKIDYGELWAYFNWRAFNAQTAEK